MSEETNTPLWGCPWHGLIRSGVVETPGDLPQLDAQEFVGTTLEHPAGSMDWPASRISLGHYGTVFMQQMPGHTPSPVTPPEMAALGMEWRDYALVGGGVYPQVHGKQMGLLGGVGNRPHAIIYFDSLIGVPWVLNIGFSTVGSPLAPTAVTVDIRPRIAGGRVSGTIDREYQFPVSQSDSAISGWDETYMQFCIVDAVPDGSKVIVGGFYWGHSEYRRYPNRRLINDRTALGFWLLEFSGTPLVSGGPGSLELQVTELATRADCLGSVTNIPMPDTAIDIVDYFGIETNQVTQYYQTNTFFPVSSPTSFPDGQQVVKVTDKVIGYWFDSSGTPLPVKYNYEFTRTCTISYSYGIEQNDVDLTFTGAYYTTTGAFKASSHRTTSDTREANASISWAGMVLNYESSSVNNESVDKEYVGYWYIYPEGGAFLVNDETPSVSHVMTGTYPNGNKTGLGSQVFPADIQQTSGTSSRGFNSYVRYNVPNVFRWCDKVFSFVLADSDDEIWCSEVLTPGGIKGTAVTVDKKNKYGGSYNPATGEVIFAQRTPVRYT